MSGLSRTRKLVTEDDLDLVWKHASVWSEERLAPVSSVLPGQRLVAVDGSTLIVPRSESTLKDFYLPENKNGEEISHYPQALMVSAWDVERRLPLTWNVSASNAFGGERGRLDELIEKLPPSTTLLLDQGYPSRHLLGRLLDSNCDFIVRMVANEKACWPEIRDFIATGKKSAIIEVRIVFGDIERNVPLRVVRRSFRPGRPQKGQKRQTMILITSHKEPHISDQDIVDAYGKRWCIETIHNELKTLAKIETWHTVSTQGIQQEVFCHMMWFLLVGHIASHLETEKRTANPTLAPRANTRRVMDAARAIATALFAASVHKGSVAEYLYEKADRELNRIRRHISTRRKRPTRPRKPFHPYARSRKNY